MALTSFILILLASFIQNVCCLDGGMLSARESESRQIQELNGMWNFRADNSPNRHEGMEKMWFKQPLSKTGTVIPMAVPSSYNDISTDRSLRDFVGTVWYDREFYVTRDLMKKRVMLRIDSAHYHAWVWINGVQVAEHDGGHLPFEGLASSMLRFDGANRITVAVNNTLTPHTLPPGSITRHDNDPKYPANYMIQNLQFDFFNYAGIHRRVRLYTTPSVYVDDITITTTTVTDTYAYVDYRVSVMGGSAKVNVEVVDKDGQSIVKGSGEMGSLKVMNPVLWEPYTESRDNYGYMYTLKVTAMGSNSTQPDIYRQPFGIRTIKKTDSQVLINDKPFYCHGFAKHEDSDIRGKGLDFPLIARDFNMLKWLGANCFRTSHYPYAEEILDQADQQGIVIIDECPGVGIKTDENFSNTSLQHHLIVMEELVRRDKNRPGVIFWSTANEPNSGSSLADHYFNSVISKTRSLDPTRLVTFVSSSDFDKDKAVKYVDVICFNRYYGWYQDTGHLDTIPTHLVYDLDHWYDKFKKPMMITEYGADTVPGLHTLPSFVFTEDYQVEFLEQYHAVFDVYRKKFLVGEMVWNFADFMTDETDTRVVGNKKGVLTRQRQPKASAHIMRKRYWSIINETLPMDKIPVF